MEECNNEYQNNLNEKNIKLEKQKLSQKFRNYFKSYCNHTSIHGFQYFGQDRTIIEKCWWIVIFIGIIISCGYSIFLIYNKWCQTPVIVSLTTKDTPIYQVPFPAVTICPTIKFSRKYINFTEYFEKMFDFDSEFESELPYQQKLLFNLMLPLCKLNLDLLFDDSIRINETDIIEKMYNAFLNYSAFDGIDNTGTFMEEEFDFNSNFRPILTDDGLCYSFNMLSTKDIYTEKVFIAPGFYFDKPVSFWIPQHGYKPSAGLDTYPRRALLSGAMYSLEIRLRHSKEDIDYTCIGAEQGYKVILHLPTRVPRPSLEYIMAPYGKASIITIKPNMMETSEVVKSYSSDKRDCYFQGERNLNFFKIYSKTNCEFECITNYTLRECGCVAFFMPRENTTKICSLDELYCAHSARKKYNLAKLKSKINELNRKSKLLRKTSRKTSRETKEEQTTTTVPNDLDDPLNEDINLDDARCHCLRSCNDITYTGAATTMDYVWKEEFLSDFEDNTNQTDYTLITLFLNSNTIFTTERNELYGPMDFLSNFGGLLGLFSGFSILSFMEIIYFCSLRIFGNKKILGKWYGDYKEEK